MVDPLERIAAALDRIAPPPPASDDALRHPAYVWRDDALVAVRAFAPLPLDLLIRVDRQKAALVDNLRRLAGGAAAQDVLLWGARGTGKSALVKAAVGAVQADGGTIALVEVKSLAALPHLFARLASVPRAFALFLDDLGFDGPAEARTLRSLLEGGAEARPANVRLIVTANRRHLVPRDIAEQSVAAAGSLPGAGHGNGAEPGAINPRDSIDDQLALADRFGLSLGFHALDQDGYCAIVAAYAERYDLEFDAAEAINWATRRGSRSGRVAWQYVIELAGRAGRSLG
ncbi:ATP-binding protein [Sphingomonas sp. A2-49]|uniref:ATP-binding protein n=1 Tax=Sphingomonas sp. A2-49 TaxID=1391375 RepID=UPI0021D2ED04|nr:ATP-binding protein [Sphingomonas sp. A2-49]MCU6455907.1 ATP-binding protein [Sphingomonas sp. A2-49]